MKYKWKSHGNAYGHKTGYTSDKGGWTITRVEGGITCWKVNDGEIYKRTLEEAKQYCETQCD